MTVNPLPARPVISNSDVLEFCEEGSVELSTAAMDAYLWSNGETTQSITVINGGSYSVEVMDVNSCWSEVSEMVDVVVNALPNTPTISPEGPINILTGDSVLLTSSAGENYLWSTGEITQSIYVKESGNFSLVHTNAKSCISLPSSDVVVTVSDFLNAPIISINGSSSICEGETVELSVESAFAYTWSNGEETQTIIVDQSGSFSVIIEDELGRTSFSSDPVEIIVNLNPSASLSYTNTSCYNSEDGSVRVVDILAAEPYTIEWDNSESGIEITNLSAGMYSATIVDANNCELELSATLTEPESISAIESIILPKCPDANDGEISMDVSGGTSPYSYTWDNGSFGSVLYNVAPGIYNLVLTDMNNCEESFEINLSYQNQLCFIIPDIITPNGDSKNDDWRIDGLEFYPDVRLEIFDRWGKRVFYSIGYETNWNGTNKGKELPMESYHYIIDLMNGDPVIIGNITIVR